MSYSPSLTMSATVISCLALILIISSSDILANIRNKNIVRIMQSYLSWHYFSCQNLIFNLPSDVVPLLLHPLPLLLGHLIPPQPVLVEPCKAVHNNGDGECDGEDTNKSTEATTKLAQKSL